MISSKRFSRAERALGGSAAASALLLLFSILPGPPAALAGVSSPDQVCAPAANPCLVNTTVELNNGAELDFGTRALEVTALGQLQLKGGSAAIRCGRFALRGGGTRIDLRPGGALPAGNLTVEARGACTQNAALPCLRDEDCSSQGAGACNGAAATAVLEASVVGTALEPGSFTLRAAGDLSVKSPITLDGGGTFADAGDVSMRSGGALAVDALISVNGGAAGGGGAITLIADGAVAVRQPVDARGGEFDGGFVTIDSNTSVSISNDVTCQSTAGGGFGGEISVTTAGDIDLVGGTAANRVDLSTRGQGPVDGAGGDGGYHAYMAGGNITVSQYVRLRADGGAPNGSGGEVLLDAGDTVTLAGTLESASLGTAGYGGILDMHSGGDINITSTAVITLTGGSPGGGIADLSANGDLSLAAVLDVSGALGGVVGTAVLISGGETTLTGTIRTRGAKLESETSSPKIVQLAGCDVELAALSLIDNLAGGRTTSLVGRDSVAIRAGAQMLATATGKNEIRYRPSGAQPIVQGTVTPAATLVADTEIVRCPVCGDGNEELGETCDDGNTTAGDGCSSKCQNEGCIADTPGYPGIPLCDDGKSCTADSCDGENSFCVHAVSCVDGVGCTTDSCGEDGTCVHAPSDALCEDSNPCTLGLCDMINDCVMLPVTGSCDDGLACTTEDACVDRECVGADTCPEGEHCSLATDQCEAGEATTTTTTIGSGGVCGDLVSDVDEECDDGDTSWLPGEECRVDCTLVDCGDPDDTGSSTATDALFTLRSAVGLNPCGCLCDVDASGSKTASDALRLLQFAVGIPDALLNCNCD